MRGAIFFRLHLKGYLCERKKERKKERLRERERERDSRSLGGGELYPNACLWNVIKLHRVCGSEWSNA